MQTPDQTLDQLRAKHAIKAIEKWDDSVKTNAAQRIKELPLMVRNLGLGQTLAILIKESQKKSESKALINILTKWLLKESPVRAFPEIREEQPKQLLKACFEGTRDQYQLAQNEALAYLGWLKIIAGALVEEKND